MNIVLRILCAILLIEAIIFFAVLLIALIDTFIDEIVYLPHLFSKK